MNLGTHLFAYAAEGAGGGVFPDETLEKEPVLSEADRDIIALNEMDAIRYYLKCLVGIAYTVSRCESKPIRRWK